MKETTRLPFLLAFAAIYFVWGSTYLGIRLAVETIPPLLMMGLRCLGAGSVLYLWARVHGAEPPQSRHWISALWVGGLFFFVCHGLLAWAERRVPSGTASLILASVPLWTILLQWITPGSPHPPRRALAGAFLGLFGILWLFGNDPAARLGGTDTAAAAAILFGGLAWAVGSVISRRLPLPASSLITTSLQLLCGAGLLLVASPLTGELSSFSLSRVSARSSLALIYLILFGSIIAFSAYTWLLRITSPAHVSTCTFVNPLIATLLAWGVGDQPYSLRTAGSALIILASVALIVAPRIRLTLFQKEIQHDCPHLVRRDVQ